MAGGSVVRYRRRAIDNTVRAVARASHILASNSAVNQRVRNVLRMAIRRRQAIRRNAARANRVRNAARQVIHRVNRLGRQRRFVKIVGTASGTTRTTSRMIVRRTPRQQRFLRKIFKNDPKKNMVVQRFGFAWMGAAAASKTIWYSVTHLKFNNLSDAMKSRLVDAYQNVGSTAGTINNTQSIANSPDAFIYVGKCTYNYELYNPTNYIMTVYIYDLVCKHDTPYPITYAEGGNYSSSAPENCMMKGANYVTDSNTLPANSTWVVGDNTLESGAFWNTVGMKPTDYHMFNTFWKVKGMKKIILPPTSSHHHVVIYNPKTKITQASLYYPRQTLAATDKNGVAGITQATLFGVEGQVAVENDQSADNTTSVGTLPGKLIVKCIKKENFWNLQLPTTNIISKIDMKTAWTSPKIFTDLIEQPAEAV